MDKIDLNRGVMIQKHGATGMDVFMYIDTPGVYLNAHGNPVPEEVAAAAGFDVDGLARERRRRERMSEAQRLIDAEEGVEAGSRPTLFEVDGYKIVDMNLGRANVVDPDGNVLNARPIPLETAKSLVSSMTRVAVEDFPKADAEPLDFGVAKAATKGKG